MKMTPSEKSDRKQGRKLARLICQLLSKNPQMTQREAHQEACRVLRIQRPVFAPPCAPRKTRPCCKTKEGDSHAYHCRQKKVKK